MENSSNKFDCIVTLSYNKYHRIILNYITYRITHKYDAEDLAQDVFIRLLDYKQMLRPDTVKYFLFTIARNIVTDYIRRYYKKQELTSYMYESAVACTCEEESRIIAKDIFNLEKRQLLSFPTQRRMVYTLNRFENQTISEISERLNLSKRTVENHLRLGRKVMRAYIRQCV